MNDYFCRETPQALQEETWFTIVYYMYLGLRGRETLHDLRKRALEFAVTQTAINSFIETSCVSPKTRRKYLCQQKELENISQVRVYQNVID